MLTVTKQITVGADDCYEGSDGYFRDYLSRMWVGRTLNFLYTAGVRFATLGLTGNISIIAAELRLTTQASASYSWDLLVNGVDLDAAPGWDAVATNRPRQQTALTAASASHPTNYNDPVGTTYAVDVTAVVTEIAARPGWDGDTMAFIVDTAIGAMDSGNYIDFSVYESGAGVPELYIEYTVSTPVSTSHDTEVAVSSAVDVNHDTEVAVHSDVVTSHDTSLQLRDGNILVTHDTRVAVSNAVTLGHDTRLAINPTNAFIHSGGSVFFPCPPQRPARRTLRRNQLRDIDSNADPYVYKKGGDRAERRLVFPRVDAATLQALILWIRSAACGIARPFLWADHAGVIHNVRLLDSGLRHRQVGPDRHLVEIALEETL